MKKPRLNINWKRTLLVAADILLAVYVIAAVTVWSKSAPHATVCSRVNIEIADEDGNGFLTPGEVKGILERNKLYPLSQSVTAIDVRRIEERLRRTPFVKTAQCHMTERGDVHITVTQRMPILHVKSAVGADYYIDDNGWVMPNSQYVSNMIIATGDISRSYACGYLAILARCIMDDDLWRNQVEQINVLPDLTVEIVPRVGDHIVIMGALPTTKDDKVRDRLVSEYVNGQLRRLEYFYRYGLSQAGWNKYSHINLVHTNQIICTRRNNSREVRDDHSADEQENAIPKLDDQADEQSQQSTADEPTNQRTNETTKQR